MPWLRVTTRRMSFAESLALATGTQAQAASGSDSDGICVMTSLLSGPWRLLVRPTYASVPQAPPTLAAALSHAGDVCASPGWGSVFGDEYHKAPLTNRCAGVVCQNLCQCFQTDCRVTVVPGKSADRGGKVPSETIVEGASRPGLHWHS